LITTRNCSAMLCLMITAHISDPLSHISRSWFAIRTKPRKEVVAKDQLENQGYEVYLPLVNTRITHARKVSWQPRPFFSGYLFVCLSRDQQQWTAIRSTIAVLAPVSFGSFYPPLPDRVIETLKSSHDENGYITTSGGGVDVPFELGEKVRLNDSSMKGLESVFVEMRGEDRALVLLSWMQRKVRVETKLGNLSAAS